MYVTCIITLYYIMLQCILLMLNLGGGPEAGGQGDFRQEVAGAGGQGGPLRNNSYLNSNMKLLV